MLWRTMKGSPETSARNRMVVRKSNVFDCDPKEPKRTGGGRSRAVQARKMAGNAEITR